jgi:hypothetical protein
VKAYLAEGVPKAIVISVPAKAADKELVFRHGTGFSARELTSAALSTCGF